jgi:hypothetical protein
MKRALALSSVLFGLLLAACAGDDPASDEGSDVDEETPIATESDDVSAAERDAICNAIRPARPWTQEESARLLAEVGRRAAETKRANDALIDQRGVGGYVGAGTKLGAAIGQGDLTTAAQIVRASGKLKAGFDANRVVREIKGTSCIGWVYRTLDAVYTDLGRKDEWAQIEKCGRAWQSSGLPVQQAFMKAGWSSPTLGFVTDAAKLPGNATEQALHQTFLREVANSGSYFGTPVSKTVMMKNFFPTPGSSTRADESIFLKLGHMNSIAFATVRAAYHVPLIVPASVVPGDLATKFQAAKDRGEPFVLESHLRREAWDKTNFEIRPLKAVIAETMSSNAVYATGTIQFAPLGGGDVVR